MDFDRELIYREVIRRLEAMGIVQDASGAARGQAVELPQSADYEKIIENMKKKTSARIGVGKAGPRLRTGTLLKLRLDHAAARDSVFFDVDQGLLDKMGLFAIQTLCESRDQFLTRPDLGAQFSPEALLEIDNRCVKNTDVQIYASDGLSSRAIEANLPNILPALMEGLHARGISTGTPFFVKFGRVASMDVLAEVLQCKVICVLIGERPGLATAESMSAYFAYKPYVGMPESGRTVISNIHSGGTPAVEAGAYLAELLEKSLKQEASGVALKK